MKRPTRKITLPELVEYLDARDRPLGIMPLSEVHRQSLFHRSVLILVYNPQGKVYLQKRAASKAVYPGRYDVSASGHVKAGESRLEAAIRELDEELGIAADTLRLVENAPASPMTGYEFVTLYTAGKTRAAPRPNPEEVSDGLFVDHAELAYMADRFRELLTPGLVHFFERNAIFPPAR
ncbi:NUDIX hydrolase [Desulfolutivibrio sulfoxidireducens]|uniref:NUDIX hydrolase n=1 Tax=Desulfolutivibrio sulfoxidireducens TaxID=2773299 RepID=UPI00159E06BB|nr:NUDIX domain-containing protein [Desulfolutivibrio sulfoxidireducens]QLA16080.1 NUDIX domain-containing protein [Desulfolutivibrio sulfoxidireducens]